MRFSALIGIIAAAALAFPFSASAVTGFATQPLWLSTESIAAGDEVALYTAVSNDSGREIAGAVAFYVDGGIIRAVNFKIGAGESVLVSTEWKATAGDHEFEAQIQNAAGISGTAATTNTVRVAVTAPPPSQVAQYIGSATQVASGFLASTTPALQSTLDSVVSTTESWREAGQMYVDEKLRTATAAQPSIRTTETNPQVLGTSTVAAAAAPSSYSRIFWSVLSTVFSSAAYFYPFFALLLIILLYIAKRALIRPHRD